MKRECNICYTTYPVTKKSLRTKLVFKKGDHLPQDFGTIPIFKVKHDVIAKWFVCPVCKGNNYIQRIQIEDCEEISLKKKKGLFDWLLNRVCRI